MTNESKALAHLHEVAATLDGAGMSWAVFAGAAASVYGADRPLTDLDILVPAREGERLKTLFPNSEVVFEHDILCLALPDVDLLAGLGTMDLDAEMAARVTHHEIGGIGVPVIPPEDNILLKAMMGRGADQGKHDWEDVEAMMAFVPSLDWAYLRWRAGMLDEVEKAQEVMGRLEQIWQKRQEMEEGTGEQD
ncbi:MAG: hypothetical protein ACK2UU_06140 [Anaerolineae bacterium]|jgi:hypothetical protein